MQWRNGINSRWLALACLCFLVWVLAACGGGGNATQRPEPPATGNCASTEIFENGACRTFAVRLDERADTPFIEDGQPVTLEAVLFRPIADERYPTVLFNHGSTGNGSDPSLFGMTFTSKSVAHYFVERGWMVAFVQRRGRGRSDGLYDEGFTPDRSGYSCDRELALAGADRALDDIDAATDWLRMRADVDTTRMLVGGVSRGGILSVAYAARRPEVYRAAINFVGGWISEGCGDHLAINRTLFVDGAAFGGPSIWLYAENDSFYSLAYSRSLYDAFTAAGGMGDFLEFARAPGLNGHFLVNDEALWSDAMDAFLDEL
ncbi:MAG: CocE/NonD family hydrolase [Woeseiaceae bacterium]|nr:CocE/NonD family hydrolase [Woeseiaceae bacterium]